MATQRTQVAAAPGTHSRQIDNDRQSVLDQLILRCNSGMMCCYVLPSSPNLLDHSLEHIISWCELCILH